MHDFVAGVISVKNNGVSLPEIIGKYLGPKVKLFMRIFSVALMVLVGAVFMSQPAEIIAGRIDCPALDDNIVINGFSAMLLLVMGVILVYYVIATLLPVDKLIGKIYPVFGFALFFMAIGIFFVLVFGSEYSIPELTSLKNMIADADEFPIIPTLFTTIACGAISGFHATQSPLMARCIRNEKECKSVFFGAMISESIIALIWAAIAMAFWGGVDGLNQALAENGNQGRSAGGHNSPIDARQMARRTGDIRRNRRRHNLRRHGFPFGKAHRRGFSGRGTENSAPRESTSACRSSSEVWR